MKAHSCAALTLAATTVISAAAPFADQRGVLNQVQSSAGVVDSGSAVTFTARGTNPCGAVNLNFGDGNVVTYPITELPAIVKYVFSKPGSYQVIARGMGNCDGEASVAVRVLEPPPTPPVPARPAPAHAPAHPTEVDRSGGRPALDRDRDGYVRRNEWPGDERSFNAHDWNRDGVLSGDEIKEAERDAASRRAAADVATRNRQEALEKRFTDLDRNRDGRITRDEWNGSREEFEALDRNNDWVLTRAEAGAASQAEAPTTVLVEADKRWTDTGVDVRLTDRVSFEATGQIRLSGDNADVADPRGSPSGRRIPNAPVGQAAAGALIARIGDSEPFEIGSRTTPVRAPRDGRLYLGVNDDHLADNQGAFRVRISVERASR